ncbi:hypothetical protein VTO42DRAFT_5868 [Malbranchea cinnamomea]
MTNLQCYGETDLKIWYKDGFQTKSHGAATDAFAAFDPSISEHNEGFLLESRVAEPKEVRS